MNGGMEYPPGFRKMESPISRVSVRMGRAVSNFANRLLPGKKLASVLMVANERTRLSLPHGCRGEIVELPENGVDLTTWAAPRQHAASARARFVFIGRLVDFKRLDIAIEALRQVPDADLEVIGDGPMRTAWEQFAHTCGVAPRVKFLGWRTQPECALHLQAATALVMPSVWDCGGAVVLEAMAAAVPVIAARWGGPADYLDKTSGILVEPDSAAALVTGFTSAMQQLSAAPEVARNMGLNGQQRVRVHFDWDRKIDAVLLRLRLL
jgi:glycosyltransferase involved in cell wall biosynthesis